MGLLLASDGFSDVCTFHERIATSCQGSLVGGVNVLPAFEDLEPDRTIREIILPELTSHCAADSLKSHKCISPHCSQPAAMFRDTCISRYGLEMLCHIMRSLIPRLGANHDDTGVDINAFNVINDESLAHFMSRAVALQQEFADAGISTASSALLKRLLKLLDPHIRIMMHSTYFVKHFGNSRRSKTNITFVECLATEIFNTLIKQGADLVNLCLHASSRRRNSPPPRNPCHPSVNRNQNSPRVAACDVSGSDTDFPADAINDDKPIVSFLQDDVSANQSDANNDDEDAFSQL